MKSRSGAAVSILFGIALPLTLLHVIAAAFIAIGGMAFVGLLKTALLLTAAFAVLGMALGLMHGLRRAKAMETHAKAQ